MVDADPPAGEEQDEAARLEGLWGGTFGDDYVDRNAGAYESRRDFWEQIVARTSPARVLEVGCNVAGNLRWLGDLVPGGAYGIDVNRKALAVVHADFPDLNVMWALAREVPFRDRWFDLVFTMGVLIHQPDDTLPDVMTEIVRCSSRWVLCGEYFADEPTEVSYRGVEGALFKRDYGRLFADRFPELELVDRGFLGKDAGWDDVTWWLFERRGAPAT
jgi:pseudaminic acid biosynthesis-associated methylase